MRQSGDDLLQARYGLARDRARGLLTPTRLRPPVNVEAIIELAGIPLLDRALPEDTRATIGGTSGSVGI